MENQLEPTKLSRLKSIVDILKDKYKDQDVELSFEFLIGSLYPHVWKNIQQTMKDEYTKGYLAGLHERSNNETQGIN